MKLTDFYALNTFPVKSVNSRTGDIVLNASDVNAVSKSQIGFVVPSLKDGIVPDNQLPKYAKLVNGKIISSVIPSATTDRVGGIKLGNGFQQNEDGSVNAIGKITQQQINTIQLIQKNGNGDKLLADNGTYISLTSDNITTKIQFSCLKSAEYVEFDGILPLVSLLSLDSGYYYILSSGDVQYSDGNTLLYIHRYISDDNTQDETRWIVFLTSAIKYVDVDENSLKYRKMALTNALIYG